MNNDDPKPKRTIDRLGDIPSTRDPRSFATEGRDTIASDIYPLYEGLNSVDNTELPLVGSSRRRPVLITLDGRRVSERFVLSTKENVIGRDIDATIKASDGEVSRRHCIITWKNFDEKGVEDPVCILHDNNSTNGTFLNNEQLGEDKALSDGDMIRVGRTVFGFFLKDERVLELDQLLLNMALHDSLTGLFKREYFFSELHREFDRARRHERPLTVALLDIDHFKNLNDEYGHLKGDEALRQFADLMRLSLREGDISGRYGGEEFALVYPETEMEGAIQATERIRQAVEQHFFTLGEGVTTRLTVSAGVAMLNDHHQEKMQLLDEADHALYKAKRNGRNRVVASEATENADGTHRKTS